MRIKKYACEQYAGTTNRDITFQDGINVVLGKNESGKSTMVSGIYDVLTKSTKLDARKDKEFLSGRFPANGANVVDGTVEFETAYGNVKVKKEWDKKNPVRHTTLVCPDGMKLTGETAEGKLAELIRFGPSVYGNVVFGRQNNEQEIMDWFYSFLDTADTGAELEDVRKMVSGAVSAAGGVSEELFRSRLVEKINALSGHWDMELSQPEGKRGISRPWKTNVGQILEAYYKKEQKAQEVSSARELLSIQKEVQEDLAKAKESKASLENKMEELTGMQAAMESFFLLKEREHTVKESLEEKKHVFDAWPQKEEQSQEIYRLMSESFSKEQQERKNSLLSELEKISEAEKEIRELETRMNEIPDIEADFESYRDHSRSLPSKEALLESRLSVKFHINGNGRVRFDTHEKKACMAGDGETEARGFAKLSFGDGSYILVEPAGLDTEALESEVSGIRETLLGIRTRYGVGEEEAMGRLGELYKEFQGCRTTISGKKLFLESFGKTADGIREELGKIPEELPDVREGFEEAVKEICREYTVNTLEAAYAVVMAQLDAYRKVYNTREDLENSIRLEEAELEEISVKTSSAGISMTKEEYDWEVKRTKMQLDELRQKLEKMVSGAGAMDAKCADLDIDQLEQEESTLGKELEDLVTLCRNYQKILADFDRLKENSASKFDQFFSVFNRYLSIATDGNVSVDERGVSVKSGRIHGDLLSKGTRQSVLLAFRLAVLWFYFQDEPGLVVLDDTLLDLDETRRIGAAGLIQEFARKNQVIFLTCDPAMAGLLGGNLITV